MQATRGHAAEGGKQTPHERKLMLNGDSLEAEANLLHRVRAEAEGIALVVHVGPWQAEGGGESGGIARHDGPKRALAPAILPSQLLSPGLWSPGALTSASRLHHCSSTLLGVEPVDRREQVGQ